jgi:hypothetical protein
MAELKSGNSVLIKAQNDELRKKYDMGLTAYDYDFHKALLKCEARSLDEKKCSNSFTMLTRCLYSDVDDFVRSPSTEVHEKLWADYKELGIQLSRKQFLAFCRSECCRIGSMEPILQYSQMASTKAGQNVSSDSEHAQKIFQHIVGTIKAVHSITSPWRSLVVDSSFQETKHLERQTLKDTIVR